MTKIPLTNEAEDPMVSYFEMAQGQLGDKDYIFGKARGSLIFQGNPYLDEIKEILLKLYRERGYASILGTGQDPYGQACVYLNSIILGSANKYGQIIKSLTGALIDDIIKNIDSVRTETETNLLDTITDADSTDQDSRSSISLSENEATSDSSLRKRNDTPQAGNNPNLTNDTYLSQSERNTAEIGARSSTTDLEDIVTRVIGEKERTHHKEGTANQNYTQVTRIANLDSVAKVWTHLQDAYANWLDHIDEKALVI